MKTEAILVFLDEGARLAALTNQTLREIMDIESRLQLATGKANQIRAITVRKILDRLEYQEKGIKALGPNAESQQQELERLLGELDRETDYKVTQRALSQLETDLALARTTSKELSHALKYWQEVHEIVALTLSALLTSPEFVLENGPDILRSASQSVGRVNKRLGLALKDDVAGESA